ncbi:MAG: hypothetical protein ACYSWP_11805 [Planctomycetota bacterium]|jgi:hypothetical protein
MGKRDVIGGKIRDLGRVFLLGSGVAFVIVLWSQIVVPPVVSGVRGGWIWPDNIEWGSENVRTSPVVIGDKVVAVERQEKKLYFDGLKLSRVRYNFLRDRYYISARGLKDGDQIYRTKMRIKNEPFQVCSLWGWGSKVVVWGYYQKEAGYVKRNNVLLILDEEGKVFKKTDFEIEPLALDEYNGLLICGREVYQLPSCAHVSSLDIEPFTSMVCDGSGNLYVNHVDKDSVAWGDYILRKSSGLSSTIRKYSVVPFKQLWSREVFVADYGESGYPNWLRYDDGFLWYCARDEYGRCRNGLKGKWRGPVDAITGELSMIEQTCDSFRLYTKVEGVGYVVARENERLCVRRGLFQ